MASVGTLDFKLDLVNTIHQDFYGMRALTSPKATISVTGILGAARMPQPKFIVASNHRMASWAAGQLGLDAPDWHYISTSDNHDATIMLRGRRLTLDDLVFAPGYRNGHRWGLVKRELLAACPEYTGDHIIDFEDDR